MSLLPSPVEAVVTALIVAAVAGGGWAVYHGIQVAAINKVALQQERLVAADKEAAYKRNIAALQQTALDAQSIAAQLQTAREALHAIKPITQACLVTPVGTAWLGQMRQSRGLTGPKAGAPAQPLGLPAPAAVPAGR